MKARLPDAEPPPPETGCTGQPGFFCRVGVPWLVRRRRLVLGLALVAWAAGAFFTVRLYSNLRSGFEELLPDTAPSVVAARTIQKKLHNVTHLAIVLEGTDGDALERFADALVPRLRALPPELVERVEHRVDDQAAFLRKFGGLYLAPEDLDTIQRRLDARIAWEKRKANPMLGLLGEDEDLGPAPSVEFKDLERKYGAIDEPLAQFRNGYFQTPDGRILVVLVRPPEGRTDLASNQRVLDAVKKVVGAVDPGKYDPTVRVGYGSEVATLVEEQAALESDLIASTVVVLVLCLLALWIFFRRWTAILAIFGALGVGTALTFGLSWFLVGYLNANTAFLGSIVVGNGINVSIIVVARFLEERRRGTPRDQAIQTAWSGTLAATFVAAFGAGLAYLALAITDFKGFSQFGLIGGLGMALCWLTSYLLLPSLLAALDRRSKRAAPPPHRPLVGGAAWWLVSRHGRAVRVASLVLLAASVAGVLAYRGPLIEYELDKLRAAKSAESGAMYWGRKTDQVFRAFLTPTVIRAETPQELDQVVAALQRRRTALGAADPVREVRTLATAVPPDQDARLERLVRLRETLTDARIKALDPEARKKALALRPPRDLRPVGLSDLPDAIRLPLVERDGTAGRIALVFPRHVGFFGPEESRRLGNLIRGAIADAGVRAQAVGNALLFNDIADAILRDGPIATLVAFGAVVALVALALRRVRPTVQVLASLLLGVAWLVGAATWARVRLNFLNFVVFPITFGIGVDYAANIVQRWRLEGPGSLDRVLRETGGAVALCSLTTIIGYGSLLAADNRALRGFGLLASLGEMACLGAALVALPAFLLRPRRPARIPVSAAPEGLTVRSTEG